MTPSAACLRCRRCETSQDLCLSCGARYLGMSKSSMTRLIKSRALAHYRYPVGGKRVSVADLDAFKDSHRQASVPIGMRIRQRVETGTASIERAIAQQLALKKRGRRSA